MKYIVLEGGLPDMLEDSVNSYIDKGYVPIGGVSLDGRYNKFLQAMIKKT